MGEGSVIHSGGYLYNLEVGVQGLGFRVQGRLFSERWPGLEARPRVRSPSAQLLMLMLASGTKSWDQLDRVCKGCATGATQGQHAFNMHSVHTRKTPDSEVGLAPLCLALAWLSRYDRYACPDAAGSVPQTPRPGLSL